MYIEPIIKKRHLRHFDLEVLKNFNLFYFKPRAYANLNLDNGEAHKNVRKVVYSGPNSRYNMFIKRRNTPMTVI